MAIGRIRMGMSVILHADGYGEATTAENRARARARDERVSIHACIFHVRRVQVLTRAREIKSSSSHLGFDFALAPSPSPPRPAVCPSNLRRS